MTSRTLQTQFEEFTFEIMSRDDDLKKQLVLDHDDTEEEDDDATGDLSNGFQYTTTAIAYPPPPPYPVGNDDLAATISPAPEEQIEIRVYKRRWYVLVLFGLFCFTQAAIWNTWGPISTSSEFAFGWNDATIAWLQNWGPVSYILTGLFFPWLLQVKGLRWATVISMLFVVVGACFRVITSDPDTATILIHIGQFLNGIAGPIGMGGIPTLSAAWFPPHERITASAITISISTMGSAVPFIIGPALVSGALPSNSNSTSHVSTTHPTVSDVYSTTTINPNTTELIHKKREDIMRYMYYECGWAGFMLLVILIYFPAKPPHPPCLSASVGRDSYWPGLWSLRKKGYFLIVAITYGVSLGVLNCWATVININLDGRVSEDTAGWIGFYATVGACAVSLIVGRFADLFARFMKLLILILYILGTASLVVFALILIKVIPFATAYIYVTVISANVLVSAAVPMMYELACELAYPTSESAANGLLTYFNNFWGLVFLAVFSFPNIGTMWMNWVAIGSTGICIPLIAMLKGRFKRLEVDEGLHKTVEQEVVVQGYGIQA